MDALVGLRRFIRIRVHPRFEGFRLPVTRRLFGLVHPAISRARPSDGNVAQLKLTQPTVRAGGAHRCILVG